MNEAVLHLRDGPRQEFAERARRSKIELGKFAPEGAEVERGCDGARGYALIGMGQFPGQKVVPALAILARRKKS